MANRSSMYDRLLAMKDVFASFDRNGDGSVDVSELGEVIKKLGRNISPQELNQKFAQLDKNGNGKINFDEFIAVSGEMLTAPMTESEIEHAFKIFDQDGSGKVSVDELKRMAKVSGIGTNEQELDAMIKEADADGDGQVNYEEFKRIMIS